MSTHLATSSPWLLLVASLASILAVGRVTRIVVYDKFPPAMWIRDRYVAAAGASPWAGLVTCPFCFAPWAQLASLTWAWFGGLDPDTVSGGLWWFTHLWFALAYLASMIVVRDQPYVIDDDADDDEAEVISS